MKPIDDLKNEHRVIERMLGIVSRACDRLMKGTEVDPKLFVGASDFFRNFADKCHHTKEEKLLFEKMIERGMSRQTGPIAVMLAEHEQGRAHVKRLTQLSEKKMNKKVKEGIVEVGRGYVSLLTAHIQKEDNILYPMADRILTKEDQEELEAGFEEVEEKVMGPGVHERYHRTIEDWEEKFA